MTSVDTLVRAWRALAFPSGGSDPTLGDLKGDLAGIDTLLADLFVPSPPDSFAGDIAFLLRLDHEALELENRLVEFLATKKESQVALAMLGYLSIVSGIIKDSLSKARIIDG